MRYIISSEQELIIKWGGLIKEIDLRTIINGSIYPIKIVRERRLSGLKNPGYSVGLYELNFEGKNERINMFATNFKNLVIIRVQKGQKLKLYGITPKEPEIFLKELRNRIKNNIEGSKEA